MIIAVCADKGAPGVTTLAAALTLAWPVGSPILLETDPAGGDLTFRLRPAAVETDYLAKEPSLLGLAADARTGSAAPLSRYAQTTALGLQVIPGPLRAEAAAPLRSLWSAVAQEATRWPAPVIADLGRFLPGHAGVPIVEAATVVLVMAQPDPESLYRVRERSAQLAYELGGDQQRRNPVVVVVRSPVKTAQSAVREVRLMLQAAGLPIPVAGYIADDPAAVAALAGLHLNRALSGSALLKTAGELANTLLSGWMSKIEEPAQ